MKIRKTLCAILAFSIFMTTLVFGAETSKLSDSFDEPYKRANAVLSALGIMQGKTETEFGAEDFVTRAEICRIILKFIGFEPAGAASESLYSDVTSEHWAKQYIDTATALGFLNGNADGTFAPENAITAAQALKIIVCVLGYEQNAIAKGGYPSGYTAVAGDIGILKGVSLSDGADKPLTAQKLAVLLYNALEVDLMELENYGSSYGSKVSKGNNVLGKYHDTERKKGIITDVYESADGAGLAKDECVIDGEKYKTAIDLNQYLGYYGEFYCKTEEKGEIGTIIAFFPYEKSSGRNEVDFEDVLSVNVSGNMDVELKYYKDGGSSLKRINLSAPIIYYNGKEEKFESAAQVQTFIDSHMKQGRFILQESSGSNALDLMFIENYTSYTVADTNTEYGYVMYNIYSADKIQRGLLDLSSDGKNDRKVFYYNEDGKTISPGELMVDDVISVYESSDGKLYKIYRSKKQVTGVIERRNLLESKELSGDVEPEEPAAEYTAMSEIDMSGFTLTRGGNGKSAWGLTAEKSCDGRTVQLTTEGGGGSWMINKLTDFVNWSESEDNSGTAPDITKDDKIFCLRREPTDDGAGIWGTPTPATGIILNSAVNNNRIKRGDKVKVTAWVYPSRITTVGGNCSTDEIDQSSDVNYRMWLMAPWQSNDNPGYYAGSPGPESSVGKIPANKWSEISFEYTVDETNKNVTSVRIDNNAGNGELYPLRLYLAGIKVEKLTADGGFKGEEYIPPTDTGRYELYINGYGYKAADGFYASMVPGSEEVTLLLDCNNRIAGFIAEEEKSSYGLLLNVIKSSDDTSLSLIILETDGTRRTYETTENVRAYNGSSVVKMPAVNLVTDQPSDPMTDWHLWSTDNAVNFRNLNRLWLTDKDKSKAASRKIIYYKTNAEGKINTIIVPSVPEDNPECRIKMVSNYDVDTWRSRGVVNVTIGSRQIVYANSLDMFDQKRERVTYKVSNTAVLYEAFSMDYDESDYTVAEHGATNFSAGNVYGGMSWNEVSMYKYPGSNTIDFLIITPKEPNKYTTVVVDSVSETIDGFTLNGWADGGRKYSAKIKPNTRLMEYIPAASLRDDDSQPQAPEEAYFVTRDMIPELAAAEKHLYGITRESAVLGSEGTPDIEHGSLEKGDIVRVVDRDGVIVYLEIARRMSSGVTVTHSSTGPNSGMYWPLFTMETSVRGEVTDKDTQLGFVEVKGYYADVAEQFHSQKYSVCGGGVPKELTTWLNVMKGITLTVYDCKTKKGYAGSIDDVEIGDEIYSWSYASAPSGIVLLKNYNK